MIDDIHLVIVNTLIARGVPPSEALAHAWSIIAAITVTGFTLTKAPTKNGQDEELES